MPSSYLNWRLVKKSEFNPMRKNQTWKEATCVEKLSGRSYVVKSGNDFFRRNRQFLRPVAEPSPTEKRSTKAGSPEPEVSHKHKENPKVPKSPSKLASPMQGSVEGTVATETQVLVSASKKTRTWTIRLSSRFKDFDMKH